ncbi:zinc finger [Stylonychia lemnae]|uniref:Zinc finger n=1 Tax=Stylonychia lemnae TaxID=5949 RepID=A0A078AYX0_STYLE|nr:zinc finger [Stylonychia lemnae]|eukprot:CDW87640.1 zinc finger [Stylonychia lemnae]
MAYQNQQNLPQIGSNSIIAQNSPAVYSNKANDFVSQILGKQSTNQMLSYETNKYSSSSNDDVIRMKSELQACQKQLQLFKQADEEKNRKIEQQRAEITKLRKDTFDYKSQINILSLKLDEERKKNQELRGAARPRGAVGGENGQSDKDLEEIRALQLAIQFEEQERRQRDRTMMMEMMMGHPAMLLGSSQQLMEQQQLERVIEESKRDNPDNMTYEQMLELGERIGKVSKGFTKEQISKIPWKFWRTNSTKQNSCSVCFEEFANNQKFKILPNCQHEYHSECINKWLEDEKRCPVCNKNVEVV